MERSERLGRERERSLRDVWSEKVGRGVKSGERGIGVRERGGVRE